MRGFTIGMLFGAAVATACLVPVIFQQRHDQFASGSRHGRTVALLEVTGILDKEFGRYDGTGKYTRLFSIKTSDVVSTETNGIKTVRVIE